MSRAKLIRDKAQRKSHTEHRNWNRLESYMIAYHKETRELRAEGFVKFNRGDANEIKVDNPYKNFHAIKV